MLTILPSKIYWLQGQSKKENLRVSQTNKKNQQQYKVQVSSSKVMIMMKKKQMKIRSKILQVADQISKQIDEEEKIERRKQFMRKKHLLPLSQTLPIHKKNHSCVGIYSNRFKKLFDEECPQKSSGKYSQRKLQFMKGVSKNKKQSLYFHRYVGEYDPILKGKLNSMERYQQLPSIRRVSLDAVQNYFSKKKLNADGNNKFDYRQSHCVKE